jgi:acetolactate synthase-1/2/3 large subunit
MQKMRGGHALAKCLEAHGVEHVFGIPGSHILSIYDGLIDDSPIRPITTRHEQGAAFMADGYARVAQKPGVALVTAGPGLLNAMTGLLEAYQSSTPVLLICGEVDTEHLGKDWGALHELKDQTVILESVTKWRECVTDINEIPAAVDEAFRQIYSGCPKPVALSIPYDVLDNSAEFELASQDPEAQQAEASKNQVARLADIMEAAESPMLYAGWGASWSDAGDELSELSELLQCPIVTTERGKGVVGDNHPNMLGNLGQGGAVLKALSKADAVLAVGTRFDELSTFQWKLQIPEGCKLIHIDIDEAQIGKIYPPDVGITGDAKTVLRQLLDELKPRGIAERASRASEFAEVKRKPREQRQGTKGLAYMEALADAMPSDAIALPDTTITAAWTGRYLPVYKPRAYLTPSGSTTMGFALPAAIGAKLAAPARPAVAIMGDGGFMFTASELATAAQNDVNIVVIIFNDKGYGWIRFMQDMYFGRRIQDNIANPDFVKFAESFGIQAARVDSPEGLSAALASAVKADSPVVIEVADNVGSPY